MQVFIIGMSGAIGGLLADRLRDRGVVVRGLVRGANQQADLQSKGVEATVGNLGTMSVDELARAVEGSDVIVYTAGSNGGARDITDTIDGNGVSTALKAAEQAGVRRFALVSVFPESWRERALGEEVEHYFAVKKAADVAVTRSGLDWLILRPSLLLDDPGVGTISLGPAEVHDDIAREDVADTLAELLCEPRISCQILELNRGTTPIGKAVAANVRSV
ncbi:NAD(P)-binding oxidoreductase [Kribbella sp. NPDC004875]|uniref:NAD(P)-binding oxidoreductase n=1 Tax=Kribbella sp. NPDC004875 TaxID=3364107 RepID=UPI003673A87A